MEEEVVVIKRSPSDEYASKLRDLTKIGKDSHSNEKTSQGASGSATTPPPTPPTTPPPTPSTPPPPSPTAPPAPAPSAGGKMDTESDDGKYEGVNEDWEVPKILEDSGVETASITSITRGGVPVNLEQAQKSKRWAQTDEPAAYAKRVLKKIKNESILDVQTDLFTGDSFSKRQYIKYKQKQSIGIKSLPRFFTKTNQEERDTNKTHFLISIDHSGSTNGGLDNDLAIAGAAFVRALGDLGIPHSLSIYSDDIYHICAFNKSRNSNIAPIFGSTRGSFNNNEPNVVRWFNHIIKKFTHDGNNVCIILTDGCGADIDNERKILQKTDPNASVYCIGVSSGFNRKSAIEIYGEEFTYEAKDVNDVMNKFVEIAQKELDATGRG